MSTALAPSHNSNRRRHHTYLRTVDRYRTALYDSEFCHQTKSFGPCTLDRLKTQDLPFRIKEAHYDLKSDLAYVKIRMFYFVSSKISSTYAKLIHSRSRDPLNHHAAAEHYELDELFNSYDLLQYAHDWACIPIIANAQPTISTITTGFKIASRALHC